MRFGLLACTMLVIGATSMAQEYRTEALVVTRPWSRATPPGATVAGGYLQIENRGSSPDRLTGATAPIASRIEIHEMRIEGDVMKMRPLSKGLEIRPGSQVRLAPGGYHLMFMGLKEPLKQGQRFRATLLFERAGPVDVEFAVEAMGSTGHKGH